MIQAPGLNAPGTAPPWLADIQICHEFRLSEEQYDDTSLEWKRRAMVYLRGKSRAERQQAQKAKNRNQR